MTARTRPGFVTQRIVADPARGDGADTSGTPGDCLRAAVASLLGVPYGQVPHFALHGRAWFDSMRRWARTRGGDFACLAVGDGAVRQFIRDPNPDMLLIGCGPSPRNLLGGRHVVLVDLELQTVWDPHPSRAGIPHVDEVYAHTRPYFPPPPQRALCAAPTTVEPTR